MSEPVAQEHRNSARVELDLRVHLRDANGGETMLLSHDWSSNSVFLRTHMPLPIGTFVSGYVVIPELATKAEIRGIVARVVKPSDVAGRERPPGMGLRLTVCPEILQQYVLRAARSQAILETPMSGNLVPNILVVGYHHGPRVVVAHALDRAGFEVIEAETTEGALDLVSHGVLPDVVVMVGDEDIDLLLRQVENASGNQLPQLAVLVGASPKIGRFLTYPLIAVPTRVAIESLASVIRQLVHGKQTTFEVVETRPVSPVHRSDAFSIEIDTSDAETSAVVEQNGVEIQIEGPTPTATLAVTASMVSA